MTILPWGIPQIPQRYKDAWYDHLGPLGIPQFFEALEEALALYDQEDNFFVMVKEIKEIKEHFNIKGFIPVVVGGETTYV